MTALLSKIQQRSITCRDACQLSLSLLYFQSQNQIKMSLPSPAQTYDLIFLFGPPLFDKSSYLPKSIFRTDHLQIVPRKLFEDNPTFGLRDLSLQIVSELKQDKQVFIEDDLHSQNTRKSILNIVKKKVPKCQVLLVKITPAHGLVQVLWSHLNAHGRGLLCKCSCQTENTHVKHWFDSSHKSIDYHSGFADVPEKREGFDIMEIDAPFQIQSNFKFEVPGLFVQWEAAVSLSGCLNPALIDICDRWTRLNAQGRIILIYDGKNDIRLCGRERDALQLSLKQLAIKIRHPVYIVKLTKEIMNNFCLPPQPGILAFLQTQHLIHLQAKSTLYIYETNDHMKMAQTAGVKHVKGNKASRYPEKVLSSLCVNPPIPAMLKDVRFVKEEENKTVVIPFFHESLSNEAGFVSQSYHNGLEEQVFSPGALELSKLQETFVNQVTAIDEPGSKMFPQQEVHNIPVTHPSTSTSETKQKQPEMKKENSFQNLPVWMHKRLTRKSTDSSLSGVESDEQGSSFRFSKTVYIMSEKELKEIAVQVINQAGKCLGENAR